MAHGVCPWWLGYVLASPLRRIWQKPVEILSPHVRSGMTVLEPGPGMGFFTLDLARLAGPSGRVIALDVQPKMLAALARKAAKAGLADRILTREPRNGSMALQEFHGAVDFVLAFAVVHELPDAARFFVEAAAALKSGGRMLLAEPSGHVNDAAWQHTLALAQAAGLQTTESPEISRSRTAILIKP
jgi:SAM-dependent methyltransferase